MNSRSFHVPAHDHAELRASSSGYSSVATASAARRAANGAAPLRTSTLGRFGGSVRWR
jgi:hypothetical protein